VKKIGLTVVLAWMMSLTGVAYANTGFSEINNELFDKSHLKNIHEPTNITYTYKKSSYVEGEREDTVVMKVSNIRNTGRRDTEFVFFTGEHNRPYQARPDQRGNGVFVYFLEYDIHEMERMTGGDWRYFQRKIRWSMAEGAKKEQVEVDYNGEKVKAWQYTIQPYLNDPENSRYGLYAGKYYIFTLSEDIPGEIYQVRTIVPDGRTWQEGDVALIDESLTITDVEAQ
jgi:hypothetical protein